MRRRSSNRARPCDGAKAASDPRAGVSTLDYILLLGVILPMVAVIMPLGRRIITLVYEMICVLISWPFL